MSSARDYPRRRVALACEVCRLRKTRCDAKKPSCSLCIELEIECVYNKPSTGKRTRDTSPDATRTAQRLNRIEASLRNISSALGITQTHAVVGTPQSQLTEHLSTPSASFPSDSRHRYGCKMPNLLVFKAPDADSTPWSYDCTENFFSEQMDQMADMRRALRKPTQNHDLSPVEARRLQRSFAENLLRWVPLFDHATASAHLESMKVSSSDRTSSSQCLVLLMYAIGAIAADSSVYVQSSGDLPGFHFYCEAYAILESFSYPSKDLCTIQCWALATVYLLIAMRPLEAWRTISQASQNCILLLKAGIGRETVHSADLFNRIYWICYVLENELEVCLELTPSGLRAYEVLVPLPTSHYEEEGMYYLLALSSLRKLMVEVVDTVGLRSSNIVPYAPVVALELRKQIDDWYQHLPGSLQFPLDHSLLFDSRKAYLRCQYFALIAVVSWPFVFKCTNNSFEMEYSISNDESDPIANGARECLKAARNYLKAAEEILTEKSLASHLVIRGYFATTIILLLVYPASAAASQDLTEDRNFLQQALRNLAYWKIVPFMQQPLLQMERIAQLKGLVDDGKANAQMEIL